ncbi:hypothetical protein [Endozoicomonas ascidiicola]|uniref:hypothetical protein n=1 Tax=Endozoicomonas ascidiicola TaxID=1698521 RepID=UPI00082B73B9|nr:hypothetical protein [Endozoicomonas ascidiicola]
MPQRTSENTDGGFDREVHAREVQLFRNVSTLLRSQLSERNLEAKVPRAEIEKASRRAVIYSKKETGTLLVMHGNDDCGAIKFKVPLSDISSDKTSAGVVSSSEIVRQAVVDTIDSLLERNLRKEYEISEGFGFVYEKGFADCKESIHEISLTACDLLKKSRKVTVYLSIKKEAVKFRAEGESLMVIPISREDVKKGVSEATVKNLYNYFELDSDSVANNKVSYEIFIDPQA